MKIARSEVSTLIAQLFYIYIYVRVLCTGCGNLWITDGIWKLTFPHCMFPAKMTVNLSVSFPSVCPEELKTGQAFCDHHCTVVQNDGIPTKLDLFLDHCKQKCAKKGWVYN